MYCSQSVMGIGGAASGVREVAQTAVTVELSEVVQEGGEEEKEEGVVALRRSEGSAEGVGAQLVAGMYVVTSCLCAVMGIAGPPGEA